MIAARNESYVTISRPILPAPWKLVVLLSNSEIAAKARWLYNDEIAELGNALNNMIAQLNQLIDREYKAVLNQRNAEYRALQSQIHPHFLYNTLNGFIGLNRLGDTHGLERAI